MAPKSPREPETRELENWLAALESRVAKLEQIAGDAKDSGRAIVLGVEQIQPGMLVEQYGECSQEKEITANQQKTDVKHPTQPLIEDENGIWTESSLLS